MDYKMEEPETPQKQSRSLVFYSSPPPAKKFQKVKNPFETALTDRLHLPLIGSPSLFKRTMTPQLSSTQFEWTIDQVSYLQPANVEPHETQFHDSPDPEREAKAQSAISSFFKEQKIVPSPVDCPLRSQRIILAELNSNTPLAKSGTRIRDFGCQTTLSLPVDLPKEVEDALRPYFQPHLAGDAGYTLKKKTDIKDTSLRRQLFDLQSIVVLENDAKPITSHKRSPTNQHPNSSPLSASSLENRVIMGKLSDSLDKSSFGSLSPISGTESFSSHTPPSASLRKFQRETLYDEISPIVRCKQRKNTSVCLDSYRFKLNDTSELSVSEGTNFKPDRSSSPFDTPDNTNAISSCISESFNIGISRLKVNSASNASFMSSRSRLTAKSTSAEISDVGEGTTLNHTIEINDATEDIDAMQMSNLSTQSSNCSSVNSDTPRIKRRSAGRKNLSQSFSANYSEDEEEVVASQQHVNKLFVNDAVTESKSQTNDEKNPTFYRTDSGFNEMSTTSSSSVFQQDENSLTAIIGADVVDLEILKATGFDVDISMRSCSTPSKSIAFDDTL